MSYTNGGSLFYLIGTGPAPTHTTRSATAGRSGHDKLECSDKSNHLHTSDTVTIATEVNSLFNLD